jgi:hypothetical protein
MSFMLNALNGSIQAELVRFFNVIEIATYQQNQLAPLLFVKPE